MSRVDREQMKRLRFSINDHADILIEVLKRLDGRSLSVAACVCRLWCAAARTDSIWEYVCFRHVSPSSGIRSVVSALGGYRRLYMICVRPVHSRRRRREPTTSTRLAAWSRVELQLSLSLFCVDYYERLGPSPARFGDVSGSSLMFLCKSVNV